MTFAEAVRSCLQNYAVFRGRAPRSEFWFFQLFLLLVDICARILDNLTIGASNGAGPISLLASLALLLPSLAVAVRRLHDTGHSGWWFTLVFLPVVGWLALLYWYVSRGEDGENRFGPDPLGLRIPAAGPDDVPLTPTSIPRVPRRRR